MRLGLASVLVVPRRRSGGLQAVPVNVVRVGRARYLVSMRGETQWVRNLRAAGEAELRRFRRSERIRAVEVPVDERAPIIAAYRARWDFVNRRFFASRPDAADHPVFRLVPTGGAATPASGDAR